MLFQPRSGIRMQLRAQACEVYAFAERLGGADSPPWQRRGGRAIKKYPRSIERRGRGGSFKLQNSFFERTTPSAPIRWLRDNFLTGAATPPLPRKGLRFNSHVRQLQPAVTNDRYSSSSLQTTAPSDLAAPEHGDRQGSRRQTLESESDWPRPRQHRGS